MSALRKFRAAPASTSVVPVTPAWLTIVCRVCGAEMKPGEAALYNASAIGGMHAHPACGFRTAQEKRTGTGT